ncbi:hypothetical protein [Thalassococcus sp. S3]|uniref:hypothetical protein n=1 Tax=Thalassococcus sp. S3 TaxID=2017482 RepID=UPI00102480E9|nr:hypothetical protein [Thalassococcus sp. S3]QBF31074.1 hypothetical protein CFI11_07550 [Thalassococcus sp. S3]
MILDLLGRVADYGRSCLVLGLLAGLTLPDLALALRPFLPELVALLLAFTAFRIGPRDAVESLGAVRRSLARVLGLQLALPLIALSGALLIGASPLALVIVLLLSAPSVTGAPNFAIMMGHDPAPALRMLIVGTAILPLTVLPIFWLMPGLGDPLAGLQASGRLLVVIALATGLAFALRHWAMPNLRERPRRALDGVTAIAIAIIVIALMSAIGPALRDDPLALLGWLAAAFAVNFGLQILTYLRSGDVPLSLVAGNRNVALFLVALPPETTDPLLIFIGCYQIPMYLTPLLLKRFYAPS